MRCSGCVPRRPGGAGARVRKKGREGLEIPVPVKPSKRVTREGIVETFELRPVVRVDAEHREGQLLADLC
jgi:hypothetical protein